MLKKTLILATSFIVAGCSVTPMKIGRTPELNTPSTVGVGDAIYVFEVEASKMTDHYSGANQGGAGAKLEFLYSGLSDNQVRFTYREFSKGDARNSNGALLIRPAFQQDAQFDYNPGMRVAFKGFSMKVDQATPNEVTYQVLTGFTDERDLELSAQCASYQAQLSGGQLGATKPAHC